MTGPCAACADPWFDYYDDWFDGGYEDDEPDYSDDELDVYEDVPEPEPESPTRQERREDRVRNNRKMRVTGRATKTIVWGLAGAAKRKRIRHSRVTGRPRTKGATE